MTYEDICSCVAKMRRKYGSADALSIAESMGILVCFDSMGTEPNALKGYFIESHRVRAITINSDLPDIIQRIIAAHELCHAVNHRRCAILPFHDIALFDETSVFEKEANMFAAEFLLDDEEVIDTLNQDYTFFGAASVLGVPAELLDFKFRLMKWKGYKLMEAPIYSDSCFLKNMEVQQYGDFY